VTLIFFGAGLILGSFLFNYAVRYGARETALRGRSKCPHCGHLLGGRDLVPVVSYLAARGRCRYCEKKLSWQYPVAEIITGAALAGLWLWLRPDLTNFGQVVELLFFGYLLAAGIVLVIIDLRQKLLPDRVVVPALIVTAGYLGWQALTGMLTGPELAEYLLAGLLAGGSFLGLVAASRGRWMGGGDVKLFALVGLLLGWPGVIVATLAAFWSAAALSLGLVALGRKGFADEIPFGPFLIGGAAIALVWGEEVISSYLKLLG
jgi:leader peptidase (prepilin peptidase) / N-methyltransferase